MISQYLTLNPEITFAKNVYRRFTNNVTYKKKYTLNSNIFTFDFENENDINIVKNIWINDNNAFEKVHFLLVPKYVAPQQLFNMDFNIIKQNENIVNFNEDVTLEQLLELSNTILINSISIDVLKFLNYNNKNTEYLDMPINISNVLQLINRANFKLVLLFDKKSNEPINLIIKYYKMLDAIEITRYNSVSHEYLIKRFVEIPYVINSSTKEITPNFINISINSLMIKSPKKLNSVKIDNYDLIDTRENPENTYVSNDYYYYVLDQYDELKGFSNDAQPNTNYLLNDKIIINHDYDEDFPITITYFLYDVYQYSTKAISSISYDKLYTKKFKLYLNNIINENLENNSLLEKEEFIQKILDFKFDKIHYNMDFTNYEEADHLFKPVLGGFQGFKNNDDIYEYYVNEWTKKYNPITSQSINTNIIDVDNLNILTQPQSQTPTQYNPLSIMKNKEYKLFKLYLSYYKKLINDAEKNSSINTLLDKDTICEITMENIKEDDYYYKCPKCNGNFEMNAFKDWIEKYSKDDNCPKCRTPISEIPQLYKNSN